ncbi:MAG: FliH/SctL family protein [Actinomycetota bacterium]|nr:FliH/SctL family protein [Actinomycetota bacterium]
MGRDRFASFDSSSNAVLRFGSLRENPEIVTPLELPMIEKYAASARGESGTVFDVQERDREKSQAYNQGFADGKAVGELEANQKLADRLSKLDNAISSMLQASMQLRGKLGEVAVAEADDLARFAVEVVDEILKNTLWDRKERLVAAISNALLEAVESKTIVIRLNPDDIEAIDEARSARKILTSADVVLEPSGDIEVGGAIIETEFARVDLQLSSAMDRLRERLLDMVSDDA